MKTESTDLAEETRDATRDRVAASVLKHGPSTAQELAERLELTPAAVRRHLASLTAAGTLVERDRRHPGARGRGRPAKEFVLTDAGRESFYQAYDELATAALDYLAATGGEQAVVAFANARAEELRVRFEHILAANPAADRTEVLAAALNAQGFVASEHPVRHGEQLCQHHCPVANVARRYPQLCQAETAMFSQLLASHVQRLATIAHGDTVCTTHIPHKLDQGER